MIFLFDIRRYNRSGELETSVLIVNAERAGDSLNKAVAFCNSEGWFNHGLFDYGESIASPASIIYTPFGERSVAGMPLADVYRLQNCPEVS